MEEETRAVPQNMWSKLSQQMNLDNGYMGVLCSVFLCCLFCVYKFEIISRVKLFKWPLVKFKPN